MDNKKQVLVSEGHTDTNNDSSAMHFAFSGVPGSIIDLFVEWENNPEDDDFWA